MDAVPEVEHVVGHQHQRHRVGEPGRRLARTAQVGAVGRAEVEREHVPAGQAQLEVGVLGNDAPQASVVGEIGYAGAFYDYESKYTEGEATLQIPADLPEETAQRCRALALAAFAAVDAAGLARVDLFLHEDTLYLNEINTMPGFTQTSMYPKLWSASGVSYAELIERLLGLALEPR